MSSRAATAGASLRGRSEGGVTPWEGSDSSGDEEATAKTSPRSRSPRTEGGGGSNHSPRGRHTVDGGKGGTLSNRRPPVRSALRAGRETGADDDGESGTKSSQQGGHMQPQGAPKTAPTPRMDSRRAASGVSFAAEVNGQGRGRGEEWDGRQEPEERRRYDVEPVRWIRGDGGKGVRWSGEWASPAGNEGWAGIRQARDVKDESDARGKGGGDVRGKWGGSVGHANSYLASTGAYGGGGGGLGRGAKGLVHGGPDNFDWSGLENAAGGGRLVVEMDVMAAGGGLGAVGHSGDQRAKGQGQDQGQGQVPSIDSGIAGGMKAVMDRDGEIVVELEGGGHDVGAERGMGEMWDVRGRRKSSPRKSVSPNKRRTTSSPSKGRASISPPKERTTSSPSKGHNIDQMSGRKTSGADLPELDPSFSRSILDDGGKVGLLFDQQAAAAAAQGLSSWYDAGVRLELAPKVPSLPLARVPSYSYSLTLPAEGMGGEGEREKEGGEEGGGGECRQGGRGSRGIMSGIATSRGRLETAKSAKSVEIDLGEEYRAGTAARGREGRELEGWGGVRGEKGERIAMRPRTVRTATARRNARGGGYGFGAGGSMHHSKRLDSFEAGASASRRSKAVGAMSNGGGVRLPKTAREQHATAACRSPKARELTRLLWSTSDDVQGRLSALEWGRNALEAQDVQLSKTVDQPLCLVPYAGAKLFRWGGVAREGRGVTPASRGSQRQRGEGSKGGGSQQQQQQQQHTPPLVPLEEKGVSWDDVWDRNGVGMGGAGAGAGAGGDFLETTMGKAKNGRQVLQTRRFDTYSRICSRDSIVSSSHVALLPSPSASPPQKRPPPVAFPPPPDIPTPPSTRGSNSGTLKMRGGTFGIRSPRAAGKGVLHKQSVAGARMQGMGGKDCESLSSPMLGWLEGASLPSPMPGSGYADSSILPHFPSQGSQTHRPAEISLALDSSFYNNL